MKTYTSVIYDLTQFGIFKISNAIITADMDNGIAIEVSFDGGSTFTKVSNLNSKFPVVNSKGKIQVKILFEDDSRADIYKVKTNGFFQNLDIGTRVKFTKISTNETFTTTIGENGRYTIFLPRGVYTVWYKDGPTKTTLFSSFNPEAIVISSTGIEKENSVELFLRDVDWAKYSVFDKFTDNSKMLNGNAIIDRYGLSDGITDRRVRYWAIGFE